MTRQVKSTLLPAVFAAALAVFVSPLLAQEYSDVLNQTGMGVYAHDGAFMVRQPNGLRISMTVPTPQPGEYNYAPGTWQGHPEVFTLWAFVFNYPSMCNGPCDGDDIGNTPAKGGVYNVGGHFGSGESLTISDRIGVGQAPHGGTPLESPETAEVHVALAPHGAVDPAALPNEFRIPVGSPFCGCWWVAAFE